MTTPCPRPAELHAFHAGDLSPDAIDQVAAHLEGCPACEQALDALDQTPDPLAATVRGRPTGPSGEAAGTIVGGRYTLVELLGEGGMGTVWRAAQTEPVRREVAVKLVKAGMDSAAVLRRFAAERQALALMDHPNIARVFDAGSTSGGRPFFAMELVLGMSLTSYCDARKLTLRPRLELFVLVCRAVQHAHQKGVVHRDLKPSNVLVTEVDGRPVPKVIDFGIAKAAGAVLTGQTLQTVLGCLVGTPEYMAPEQADPGAVDVDTRADVYALGVILYELLTGSTPLTRPRVQQAALLEVLRLVREEEPPTPSSRLSTADELPSIAADRATEPRRLTGLLRGELDWIAVKCLEKDRSRRYDSATALARDVERYLIDEPVEAGPPTARYRLQKFARRYRRPLRAAAAAALLLALAAAVSGWQAVRATHAEAAARDAEAAARVGEAGQRRARETAEAVTAFMQNVFAQASPAGQASPTREVKRELTVREAMDHAATTIGDQFPGQPAVEAAVRDTIGLAFFELGEYTRSEEQYRAALAVRLADVGEDDPATLANLDNLGHVYMTQGRQVEAEDWLTRALAGRRRVLGPAHLDTSESLNNLAALYYAQGRSMKAVPLYEESLAIRRVGYGNTHFRTINTLQNLANSLVMMGQQARAEPLLREALAARRRDNGRDHPLTLLTLLALGTTCQKLHRWAEAEQLLTEALDGHRRVDGNTHPHTAMALNALSHLHCNLGHPDRAVPLLREALAIARAAHPGAAAHPLTLQQSFDLGLTLAQLGQTAEAEPLLQGAAAEFGPDPARVLDQARCRVGLGLTLPTSGPARAADELAAGYEALRAGGANLDFQDRQLLRAAADVLARYHQTAGHRTDAVRWQAERDRDPSN